VAVPGLPTVGTNGVKVAPSEATFVSPRGTFEFTRRNLRGLGETGSLSLVLARLDQRFLATYADPHFRNTRWSSLFSLSAEHTTENPLFAAQLETASFQLERPLNRAKTTSARVRYTFQKTDLSQILVPELVLPQDQHVRLSALSGSIIRDTRDKPLDAHRGVYQTVDVGITGKAIGASVNFARFLGQVAYYKEIGHGMVWANSVRLAARGASLDSRRE
jgi:outer membrane protein insertion porin family